MEKNDSEQGSIPIEPEAQMVTAEYEIRLADGWTEESFERDTYGPEDIPGVEARFSAGENTAITIDPVEYEVVGNRRRIQGLESDFEYQTHGDEVSAEAREESGKIYEPCLFGVQVHYTPISSPEISMYTLATDADDAVAVACWLSYANDPMGFGQAIERALQAQAGEDPTHYGIDYPSDEKRVEKVCVENANRCFYSGKTTRSHLLRLPVRYAPLLSGYPENAEGLPAIPSRVGGFEVAVSHTEWSDRGISDGELEVTMGHIDSGVYQLASDVAQHAKGFPAAATSFNRT